MERIASFQSDQQHYMGIVRKQSIQSSVVIYIGFIVGALNTLVLFPRYFTPEEYGLTRLIIDSCLTLSTLCTLGIVPVINKFFPFYRDYLKPKRNDLPFITLLFCLAGYGLFVIASFVFKDFIIRKFGGNSPLFIRHYNLLYPFTFFMMMFSVLESFCWGMKKTVISNFLKEAGIRVITTLLIAGMISGLFGFTGFINLYGFLYAIPALILFFYLGSGRELFIHPAVSKVTRRLCKRMLSFSGYVFSANIFSVLARTADIIFIAGLSGLSNAGVYSIGLYVAMLLDVPQRSMAAITTPLLAAAWKDKDLGKISSLYKKSSITLLVAGLFIFGIICINIDDLVKFLPAGFAEVKYIFYVLGIAKLVDLGTGVNNQVIQTSNFWKFDFVCNILLVCLILPLNYFLIKRYGMIGAAFANLVSLFVFNLVRYLFIWMKFRLQPFSGKTILLLCIAGGLIFIARLIPHAGNIYLDAIIRGAVFVILFGSLVLSLKISQDTSEGFSLVMKKLFPGRVRKS